MPYAHARGRGARPGRTPAAVPGLLALAALLASCQGRPPSSVTETVPVSGSAVHFFSTAIVHSQDSTPTGMVQRSTDIVALSGDLRGYVLYHPTSRFDFAAGTLVNTGIQIFSGTIAGSGPVILYDDGFRFEVDLATGAVTGAVHLARRGDAPDDGEWLDCNLAVTGTGRTPEGDAMAEYSGECTRRRS